MAAALACRGLSLDYGGGVRIGPLDLELPEGACAALVGANGAGKSSFIHMLLHLRPPDAGEASIHGIASARPEARRGVGYLPEVAAFPGRATPAELVRLHARLAGRADLDGEAAAEDHLRAFGLEAPRRPVRALSKGMRQRLGLALAWLDCGRLLILDEPNSGLDPIGIAMLRDRLLALKAAGTAILLSTHRLAEVLGVADLAWVLHRGRLAAQAPMERFADFPAFEKFFLEAAGA